MFRVVPDSSAQTLALLAGEADYLPLVNAADIERLRAHNDLTLAQTGLGTGGGNSINTLGFDLDRKALADLRVRQVNAPRSAVTRWRAARSSGSMRRRAWWSVRTAWARCARTT